MIKLTIIGRIPSKKNSTWTAMIKGRAIRLPSQKYKEWNKDALRQLKLSYNVPNTIEMTECITLTFYAPDKRKYDLSNKTESIMDTLVDAGILADDNYTVVPKLNLIHGGIDKENPRCEIEIV